jgi:hypothetical protein
LFHPDRYNVNKGKPEYHGLSKEQAEEYSKLINKAYGILGDEQERAKYDYILLFVKYSVPKEESDQEYFNSETEEKIFSEKKEEWENFDKYLNEQISNKNTSLYQIVLGFIASFHDIKTKFRNLENKSFIEEKIHRVAIKFGKYCFDNNEFLAGYKICQIILVWESAYHYQFETEIIEELHKELKIITEKIYFFIRRIENNEPVDFSDETKKLAELTVEREQFHSITPWILYPRQMEIAALEKLLSDKKCEKPRFEMPLDNTCEQFKNAIISRLSAATNKKLDDIMTTKEELITFQQETLLEYYNAALQCVGKGELAIALDILYYALSFPWEFAQELNLKRLVDSKETVSKLYRTLQNKLQSKDISSPQNYFTNLCTRIDHQTEDETPSDEFAQYEEAVSKAIRDNNSKKLNKILFNNDKFYTIVVSQMDNYHFQERILKLYLDAAIFFLHHDNIIKMKQIIEKVLLFRWKHESPHLIMFKNFRSQWYSKV